MKVIAGISDDGRADVPGPEPAALRGVHAAVERGDPT